MLIPASVGRINVIMILPFPLIVSLLVEVNLLFLPRVSHFRPSLVSLYVPKITTRWIYDYKSSVTASVIVRLVTSVFLVCSLQHSNTIVIQGRGVQACHVMAWYIVIIMLAWYIVICWRGTSSYAGVVHRHTISWYIVVCWRGTLSYKGVVHRHMRAWYISI